MREITIYFIQLFTPHKIMGDTNLLLRSGGCGADRQIAINLSGVGTDNWATILLSHFYCASRFFYIIIGLTVQTALNFKFFWYVLLQLNEMEEKK